MKILHTCNTTLNGRPTVKPHLGGNQVHCVHRVRRCVGYQTHSRIRHTFNRTDTRDERLTDTALKVDKTMEELLREIEGTDSGAQVSKIRRDQIDRYISDLMAIGEDESDPVDNEDIFANYNVAYTSPGPSQKGAPAGGRFRGRLGRLLFRTEGLYQMIERPDVAKNLVMFKLLGIFPGSIALVGKFAKNKSKTVRVRFQRPKFTLVGQTFTFGPESSVELITPFLKKQIRLGKGSRGSLFVFTKGGKADDVNVIQEYDRQATPYAGIIIIGSIFLVGCLLYGIQRCFGPKPVLLLMLILLLVGSVLNRGGIEDDDGQLLEDAQSQA